MEVYKVYSERTQSNSKNTPEGDIEEYQHIGIITEENQEGELVLETCVAKADGGCRSTLEEETIMKAKEILGKATKKMKGKRKRRKVVWGRRKQVIKGIQDDEENREELEKIEP